MNHISQTASKLVPVPILRSDSDWRLVRFQHAISRIQRRHSLSGGVTAASSFSETPSLQHREALRVVSASTRESWKS